MAANKKNCLSADDARQMITDPIYQIEAFIGAGAMACVYKATERRTPNVYAMKLLREKYRQDRAFIEFFEREAVSMRNLQYPNIVRFYTYDIQENYAYILMDYVEGEPLTKVISRARRTDELVPLDMVVSTMAQIARAISYLHRQDYVHRDIKPGNVLLTDDDAAYLTDLGIAGLVKGKNPDEAEDKDDMYLGAGTPSYMPYEQQIFEPVDHTADIYAFAVMMFELLTGQKPFTIESGLTMRDARKQMTELHRKAPVPSISALRPLLPPDIDRYFERALAKKPAERYQDVMDFAKDFHETLAESGLISEHLRNFDAIQARSIPQQGGAGTPAFETDANGMPTEKPKRGEGSSSLFAWQIAGIAAVASIITVIVLGIIMFNNLAGPASPNDVAMVVEAEATAEATEVIAVPTSTETPTDATATSQPATETQAPTATAQSSATLSATLVATSTIAAELTTVPATQVPTEAAVSSGFFGDADLTVLDEGADLLGASRAVAWDVNTLALLYARADAGAILLPLRTTPESYELTFALAPDSVEDYAAYGFVMNWTSATDFTRLAINTDDRTLVLSDVRDAEESALDVLADLSDLDALPDTLIVRVSPEGAEVVYDADAEPVVLDSDLFDTGQIGFWLPLANAQIPMIERLALSVLDENVRGVRIRELSAEDGVLLGLRAIRGTGDEGGLVICEPFNTVYDILYGHSDDNTSHPFLDLDDTAVSTLFGDGRRVNASVATNCGGETYNAGFDWANALNALLTGEGDS